MKSSTDDGEGMLLKISCHLCQRHLSLGQPEGHVHGAIQVDGRGQRGASWLWPAALGIKRTQAEMAVSDEGAHAPWLGERQRLTVLGLAALGVEAVGMGHDVAEQVQRMRREAGMTRRGCERA